MATVRTTVSLDADPETVISWVTKLLRDVPGLQREAVDLVDLQGFKPAEAAEMLGLNHATLRVHLHRGRRKLRALLADDSDSGAPSD